jgi:hypothetical protein
MRYGRSDGGHFKTIVKAKLKKHFSKPARPCLGVCVRETQWDAYFPHGVADEPQKRQEMSLLDGANVLVIEEA